MPPRRYAIVGTGSRHRMYRDALLERFRAEAQLVALCDSNSGRLALSANAVRERTGEDVRSYLAADFAKLLGETRPATVIVTSMDSTHDEYICAALAAGCDVITEKPLTTSAAKLKRILRAERRSAGSLTVAFNYRYSPARSQVKELLLDRVIGDVVAVDFHWLLDTRHGADYFRRWHRNKANSGGLLVHKATHHFDLVNWWLDSVPESVSAAGARAFYRPERAVRLGIENPNDRCHGCAASETCPFHFDLAAHGALKAMYFDQEKHDGYHRDRCVFSPDIDIVDAASVRARYASGALLTYSLTAFAPWEGYRIDFTGTAGRIEHEVRESSYASGDGRVQGAALGASIRVLPHFKAPYEVPPATASGGHGGGDRVLLEHLFKPDAATGDPLVRRADQRAGAWSILVGIAANTSMEESRTVSMEELVGDLLQR